MLDRPRPAPLRRSNLHAVAWFASLCFCVSAAAAEPDAFEMISWDADTSLADLALVDGEPSAGSPAIDSFIELDLPGSVRSTAPSLDPLPAQSAGPPNQSALPPSAMTARRSPVSTTSRQAAARSAAVSGVASVPYMIGDTGAGTCIGFTGMVDAMMAHPSLACGRLNIAESNSPLPTDRLYYSYRHFENSSGVSAFQFSESVNYDRHVLAGEKTFMGGMASVELRVPLERRLTSDITTLLREDIPIIEPIFGDTRETDFGNIAAIFKCLLWENDAFAFSCGLGVRMPTARNVTYNLGVLGGVTYTEPPGLTANQLVAFTGEFDNETVYLEPFLAWVIAPPGSRWFHQGFLQVEAAANTSTVTMFGGGVADFFQDNVYIGTYGFSTGSDAFVINPVQTELFAQTLMRLNLGAGYRLLDNPRAPLLQQLTAMFEAHYTTTLEDAKLSSLPMTFIPPGTAPFQDISVGNLNSRVDIINVATGLSANLGQWTVTNGFIAPIRHSPNRGFDFEYNLQVQRRF